MVAQFSPSTQLYGSHRRESKGSRDKSSVIIYLETKHHGKAFQFFLPPIKRQFKQRRFWATHVKRKWAFFFFKIPWRYQICIVKFLCSCRDGLLKNLFQITAQEGNKSTSGWRVRRCLNSLASYADVSLSIGEQRKAGRGQRARRR